MQRTFSSPLKNFSYHSLYIHTYIKWKGIESDDTSPIENKGPPHLSSKINHWSLQLTASREFRFPLRITCSMVLFVFFQQPFTIFHIPSYSATNSDLFYVDEQTLWVQVVYKLNMGSQGDAAAKKANVILGLICRRITSRLQDSPTVHCIEQTTPGVLCAVVEVSLQYGC